MQHIWHVIFCKKRHSDAEIWWLFWLTCFRILPGCHVVLLLISQHLTRNDILILEGITISSSFVFSVITPPNAHQASTFKYSVLCRVAYCSRNYCKSSSYNYNQQQHQHSSKIFISYLSPEQKHRRRGAGPPASDPQPSPSLNAAAMGFIFISFDWT